MAAAVDGLNAGIFLSLFRFHSHLILGSVVVDDLMVTSRGEACLLRMSSTSSRRAFFACPG